MSFGAIADQYNQLRSGPAQEAIDWLVPDGCEVAVDLAAGTGLLSRALARRAATVIAVEPDLRMGTVLRAGSAGSGVVASVRVVAGVGEEIPVASGSADGLFISSAWHWLDPERAVPQIARVLRDGGRFGIIWTSRDRSVDWVHGIQFGTSRSSDGELTAERAQWRNRSVELPAASSDLFVNIETQSFRFTRTMSVPDFVAMLGTYSGVITASEAEREAGFARVRAALAERFPGASELDVPMRSWCWRADRARR
jgi:SAM-dependent methyltransferase